jgi:hypothetical protein
MRRSLCPKNLPRAVGKKAADGAKQRKKMI